MFYFDEELQEWVDDESGEVEVPLPPREELKYRTEPPSPPSLGLGGKYAMGKLPNDYIPEERPSGLSMPSMLTPKDYGDPMAGSGPYDPETSAMITGYGKNLMLRKAGNPNEQPWLTPGGAIAPPEYVQDIERTMGELDRGEMSETQLGEKIKQNAGIPPKPDESKMTEFEFVQFARQKPEFKQAVEDAVKEYEKNFDYTDVALMRGPQKIAHEKDKARVAQSVARRIEASLINEYRTMKRTAEEEKRNQREKGEEEERFKRNQAAKDAAAAEKAAEKAESDAIKRADKLEKEEAARAEKEKTKFSELEKLRKAVAEATTDESGKPKDPNPDIIEPLLEMANRTGYELKKVTTKTPGMLWGENETSRWQLIPKGGEKTVEIEGKKYKDGDIVTQNGKKFRVKVK